ncbi:MAG: ribonuclease P protein component [Candidatus Liptonbacteria bacterium]|nr:ribonuclease P protein component [Candidatus Liptonbacteria bacterium]
MTTKKLRLPPQRFSERPAGRVSSGYFLIKVFKNNLTHNRFGVVIGAKVDKRSSKRNFWRRAILNCAGQYAGSGKDLLIIVSPRIRELSKSSAEQEFGKLLQKIYKTSQ